jgi:hypothetical protein
MVRNILGLREAITRDLGPNTGLYREGPLRMALGKCDSLGYVVKDEDGAPQVGLARFQVSKMPREKLELEKYRVNRSYTGSQTRTLHVAAREQFSSAVLL